MQTTTLYSRPIKRKRSYASGSRSVKRARVPSVPRNLRSFGISNSNRCVVPLTVNHTISLTADPAYRYSFSTLEAYRNGTSFTTIPGAAELAVVFDLLRLMKIEMTILPAATDLEYPNQTLSTGTTNIPWVYTGFNATGDSTQAPSLDSIQQNPSCQTSILNKVTKRTFYPKLEGSNGLVDVGVNDRNRFMKSNVSSSQLWHGIEVFMDMNTAVWTYGTVRISFKLFFECMNSR